MKRKDNMRHKRHLSNRHLAEQYIYAGELPTSTGIRLTQYSAVGLQRKAVNPSESSFKPLIDPEKINWFEVSGLNDAETVMRIVKEFGLHDVDAKDVLTPQHVSKIESDHSHTFLILKVCFFEADQTLRTEHVGILVCGKTVITFTESDAPVFDIVHKAIEQNKLSIRQKGTGLLLAFLLNTLFANMIETVSKIEDRLIEIEEQLITLSDTNSRTIGALIQQHRQEYMAMKAMSTLSMHSVMQTNMLLNTSDYTTMTTMTVMSLRQAVLQNFWKQLLQQRKMLLIPPESMVWVCRLIITILILP